MRQTLVRAALGIPVALLVATPALAQRHDDYVECFRDGRRVECDRNDRNGKNERNARTERERAVARAREAREARERAATERARAQERAAELRREQEWRRDEDRRRQTERARDARRELEQSRERARLAQRRRYYDDLRPRLSFGAGADMRRFDDANRYLAQASVDFRTRSGLGVRPEVVYGWTDRQRDVLPSQLSSCVTCTSTLPAPNGVEFASRSKLLGVSLNGTYSPIRRAWIRPYVLGGIGVFTTRETTPQIASTTAIPGSTTVTQVTYRTTTNDRVDFGLNSGAGLEFGIGPVHLYTEFRYFLNDRSTTRGFSGMMPITAGLRF